MHHVGDRIVLHDGELGTVLSAGDDGSVRIRTARGLILSSGLDDEGEIDDGTEEE
jgi:hypothetical protein